MGLRVFCVWICEGEDVGVWDGEGWSMTHPYVESEQNKIKNTKKEPFQHQTAGQFQQQQPLTELLGRGTL